MPVQAVPVPIDGLLEQRGEAQIATRGAPIYDKVFGHLMENLSSNFHDKVNLLKGSDAPIPEGAPLKPTGGIASESQPPLNAQDGFTSEEQIAFKATATPQAQILSSPAASPPSSAIHAADFQSKLSAKLAKEDGAKTASRPINAIGRVNEAGGRIKTGSNVEASQNTPQIKEAKDGSKVKSSGGVKPNGNSKIPSIPSIRLDSTSEYRSVSRFSSDARV